MTRTGRPKVEKVDVNCFACGKPMKRYPSQVAHNKTGRFFCSKECQNLIGVKPKRKKEVACQTCGKVFYPGSSTKGIYCSIACHNIGQTKSKKVACAVCGKLFIARPSDLVDKTVVLRNGRKYIKHARKYCSKACEGRARWKRVLPRDHNGKPCRLNQAGYVLVWEPDRPPRQRWVQEHRVVMEKILSRELHTEEQVHHLNRDKTDNRPENLLILGSSDHSILTHDLIKRDLDELEQYRKLYGPLPEVKKG